MSNRKQITEFLSKLLESSRLSGRGKYYSKEVTLDYGLAHPIRVDYIEFKPKNQLAVSGIEKGEFICYEVKSCKEDFHSGNGLNFEGDKNYIVTTMECYKQIVNEIGWNVGVMVAVPCGSSITNEFENPTPIPKDYNFHNPDKHWELHIIKNAHSVDRKRSLAELLFCMLRAGK